MNSTKSETINFSITGEFMTEFVRDLVLEGNWIKAVHNLKDCLHGIEYHHVIKILNGDSKLTGINSFGLEEETKEVRSAYQKAANFMYAGRFYDPQEGVHYRPYGYGFHWSWNDNDFANKKMGSGGRKAPGRKWNHKWQPRHEHYAKNTNEDIAVIIDISQVPNWIPIENHSSNEISILFERCEARPVWMPQLKTPIDAVIDTLEQSRGLDRYDYMVELEALTEKEREERKFQEHKQEMVENLPSSIPSVDEYLDQIRKEEQEKDLYPDEDPTFHNESGWITPDGRYWGCPYMGHPALAKRIARHIFKVHPLPDDIQKWADSKGWIRIQKSALVPNHVEIMGDRPTRHQKKTLANYCIKWERQYPNNLE